VGLEHGLDGQDTRGGRRAISKPLRKPPFRLGLNSILAMILLAYALEQANGGKALAPVIHQRLYPDQMVIARPIPSQFAYHAPEVCMPFFPDTGRHPS